MQYKHFRDLELYAPISREAHDVLNGNYTTTSYKVEFVHMGGIKDGIGRWKRSFKKQGLKVND